MSTFLKFFKPKGRAGNTHRAIGFIVSKHSGDNRRDGFVVLCQHAFIAGVFEPPQWAKW